MLTLVNCREKRASRETQTHERPDGVCVTERAEAGRPDAAPATECVLTDLSYQSRRLTVNYRFWQLLSLSHITEGEYLQRVFFVCFMASRS